MADHSALMNFWQTDPAETVFLPNVGQWAGGCAELNIINHASNEMDIEETPHNDYLDNRPMALRSNIPHFDASTGDSHCTTSALSSQGLATINTRIAKINSIHEMNDPRVFHIYGQLFHFRETAAALELLIDEPDRLQQVTICAVAHNLDLQYEYCLSSRQARITRPSQLGNATKTTCMRLAGQPTELPTTSYLPDASHSRNIEPQYLPDIGFTGGSNGLLMEAPGLPTIDSFSHSFTAPMESQIPNAYDIPNGLDNTQHVQHDTLLQEFGSTCAYNHDEELRGSIHLQEASVAAIAPWLRHDSITSSVRSSPSGCSSSSSHRSIPSLRKKALTGGSGISQLVCQYCGESFKQPSLLMMHKCLYAGQTRHRHEIDSSSRNSFTSVSFHTHNSLNNNEFSEFDDEAQCRVISPISDRVSFPVHSFDSNASRDSLSDSGFCSSQFSLDLLPPPGRRGPLSSSARADAKAVKRVKACWRCKILRKKCYTENPCQICPKSVGTSHWHSIGCRRKSLNSESMPIGLCPGPLSETSNSQETTLVEHVNNLLTLGNQKRDAALKRLEIVAKSKAIDGDINSPRRVRIGQVLADIWAFKFSFSPLLDILLLSPPLEQSLTVPILSIVWELLASPGSLSVMNAGPMENLIVFLCSAARYQEILDEDRLIAQSLLCLQACLEALRIQGLGQLTEVQHRACAESQCTIECISNLTSHLELYLKSFSRVIFRKEALQSNRAWWLSAFYSLCIQSLVRSCLIAIVEGYATAERTPDITGAQRSLHLALRLFIASSGGNDPLVLDWTTETMSSSRSEEAGRFVHYRLAQSAVQQSTWNERKIRNSWDYLNKIFKDDGIFDALDCKNGSTQAGPLTLSTEFLNESNEHTKEQQFQCRACNKTFEDKQAEEHQYYVHPHHSWSCAGLFNYDYSTAFHTSPTQPNGAEECGYCGAEFPRPNPSHADADPQLATERDRELKVGHLAEFHKFRECKHPKLSSISKFRLHLRGIHAITSAEWMDILGNACLREESQQESMFRSGPVPKLDGSTHRFCNEGSHGSSLHASAESVSVQDIPDMLGDLMGGLRGSSPQLPNMPAEMGGLIDTPMFIPVL